MCTGNQSQHHGHAVREFFRSVGMKHPSEVVPRDIILRRDRLRSRKKSAATVAFRLSVVRSFFEYLKAAGAVPPEPGSDKTGTALGCEQLRDCIGNRVRRLRLVISEAR
jgi:site-specific recombinase XerC